MLDEPTFAAFADFAKAAYPEQPITAALREAALAYMGTDPMEAARTAARRAAWLSSRVEFTNVVLSTLRRAGQLIESQNEAAKAELREMISAGMISEKAA
jgi:hypothetical protein